MARELMMRSAAFLSSVVDNKNLEDRAGFTVISDSSGVTAIEYGLIAGLIAIAAVAVMGTVGTDLSTVFNTVSTAM